MMVLHTNLNCSTGKWEQKGWFNNACLRLESVFSLYGQLENYHSLNICSLSFYCQKTFENTDAPFYSKKQQHCVSPGTQISLKLYFWPSKYAGATLFTVIDLPRKCLYSSGYFFCSRARQREKRWHVFRSLLQLPPGRGHQRGPGVRGRHGKPPDPEGTGPN